MDSRGNILPVRRRRSVGAISVLTSVVLGLALAAISRSDQAEGQSPSPVAVGIHKVKDANWKPELGQPLFIAVLGSDVRNGPPGGPGGRCDALHIVAVNPTTKQGSVIDIPRDSYVDVPGHGKQRINTGCFYGGPDLQVQVLKNVTGINIQYYVTTEFSNFRSFMEEIGGVELTIPYPMHDPVGSGANFEAGPYNLRGEEALRFVRNRHDTPMGDFSRTENQGMFIIASLAKYRKETVDPHKIFDYIKIARKRIKITVPTPELIKMALLAREIDPANMRQLPVRGTTGKAGEASVVFMEPGDIFVRVRDDAVY